MWKSILRLCVDKTLVTSVEESTQVVCTQDFGNKCLRVYSGCVHKTLVTSVEEYTQVVCTQDFGN